MNSAIWQGLLQRQIQSKGVRKQWLHEAGRNGHICFLVGSGISQRYGVPMWRGLIRQLGYSKKLIGGESASAAETILSDKFGGDSVAFVRELRRIIYSRRSRDWYLYMRRPDLEAMAMVCLFLRLRCKINIVSFNYDSYLEEFLALRGLDVARRLHPDEEPQNGGVVIWYPHGYLPFEQRDREEYRTLVLDRASFHNSRMSEWWPACTAMMKNNICIFFGLSGECPNQDYLAFKAAADRERQGRTGFGGLALCGGHSDRKTTIGWKRRRIYPLECGKRYEMTGEILCDILG